MKPKDKIRCDKCGWITEGYVPDWHNKSCPSCKDYIPITDIDLKTWKSIQELINSGLAKRQSDASPDENWLRVTLSTKNLRNKPNDN